MNTVQQKQLISGHNCIHWLIDPEECNKPAVKASHGYLCKGHYEKQQSLIPPAQRKPHVARAPLTHEQHVQSIISSEAALIASGKVSKWRRGTQDPFILRIWEPNGN